MHESIEKNRGLYIFESIVFIILGMLAIAAPVLFTYSIEVLIGAIFLVGGLIQGYRTFKTNDQSSFIGSLIMSIIFILFGLLLLAYPITGIITLTLFVALILCVEGIIQLYLGFQLRGLKGRGWTIFSGLVSLVLGIMIWSELPGSAAWVIGLFVGINMLIVGISQFILVTSLPENRPVR